ncbi:hypothetical protein AB3662_36460 [Sorangium cellulosum]|uniref:hypothetical protein n=1 Tax=Sorangium cellulosum TaxID=56 RepID=UPI003D9AAC10
MRIFSSVLFASSIALAGCGELRPQAPEPAAGSVGGGGDAPGGGGAGGGAPGGGGEGGAGDGGGGAPETGGAGAGGEAPLPPADAWHRLIAGPDIEQAMALAIDPGANVLVAGSSRGPADFGAGPTALAGFEDLFVAKYTDEGALRWAQRFGGGLVTSTGAAIFGNDGVVVVGHYASGPLEVGALSLEAPEDHDIFAVALDGRGNLRWARRAGGPGDDLAGRVAAGPGDSVTVAGQSGGSLLLARFAIDGTPVFERRLGSLSGSVSSFAPIFGVAVDPSGDIVVAGSFSGGADLGGGPITGLRGDQAWVAKYSGRTGAHLWSRHFGAPEDHGLGLGDEAQALLVDARGDVLVAGQLAAGAELGKAPIDGAGGAFLAKLAGADGEVQWAKVLPAARVGGTSLSFTPDGRVALIASLGAPFDLGGGAIDERGSYVAVYEPATGAFGSQRHIAEVGAMIIDTQNGFFGLGAAALDAKGRLSLVTSFHGEAQSGYGTLRSEGWGDVLVAHVPL